MGIVMSILGFLDDQRKLEAKLNVTDNAYMANNYLNYVPGLQTEDRFRLNNLSFAGPVIMGLGGETLILYASTSI